MSQLNYQKNYGITLNASLKFLLPKGHLAGE